MPNTQTFIAHIRELIAKDDFRIAIQQLSALLKDSPLLDEAIQQSARYNNVMRQIRLGLVDFASANIAQNQIRYGVLELLREIEEQAQDKPNINMEVEDYAIKFEKNVIKNSTITAGGNINIGDVTYSNNYFAAPEVKIPHRLTNNIPTNADHILGRATELAHAKDYLAKHQAFVLFNGIGGIGKTALASKYMAVYGSDYKHLAWITVQSTLAEAFTNNAPLLSSLDITKQVQDYIATKQLDKAFEYLFHQLNLLERTLVVIDNANDLDDLDQYKNLFETANCHFLITSRSQPSEWATVEVDSLPEDDALRLFKKLHPSLSIDDEAIKDLLSKLFYHTLLIELVARAGATKGISFTDLQTMIDTQFIHHQSLNETPIATGKHGSMVATNLKKAKIEDYIWLIFSQVKGLDEGCKQLLKAISLLPVATPFDLDFLKGHFVFFNIPNPVAHLDALIERGWLQKEQAEGQKPYFKIHPLIADVVVEHLEVSVGFAKKYTKSIANLIDYDNTNTKHNLFKINKNKRFAKRLSELFIEKNTEDMSEIFDRLGNLEQNFGFYQKAAEYNERALSIAETIFDKNHTTIADYQSNLAMIYQDLGRYEEAVKLCEKALVSDVKNFGEEHSNVVTKQSNLALIYQDLGRYEEAVKLCEKALVSNVKNFGKNHPSVAILQFNLANLHSELGRNDKSAELLEAALRSNLTNFDKNHPQIANCQSSLAIVYWHLGRYNEAIELFEAALESDLTNFGKNHPQVAIKQSNLANAYGDLGRNDEAAELLETALASDLSNFGNEHHSVSVKQSNLALVYSNLGRYEAAATLLEKALAIKLKNFGNEHPSVTSCQSNLANVYKELGRYEEAATLLEVALASDLKNFGNKYPNITIYQSNLGDVYRKLSRYEEAATLLETALASNLNNFDNDHQSVTLCQSNLGLVYEALGRYEEAIALLEAALISDLKNFGDEHPSIARCQNNLAIIYYFIGRKTEARLLWQSAYVNFHKNFGIEHPHTILLKQHSEM